ncbi:ArsR/SmtB family transcription factor [Clostridium beijerinckii]|uniref:ArsR/SmtB family transcription factor n=1 Tax=Clostridium beijerinckii TaxID=1520 RepID=UPI00098CC112|nr:metalloregulator ArsR/SmtB family transcription factor [Clostridium beijerinckii]NRT80516.1 DNA-binding transcriptional ArsR family regulator [Clostridium beijerinckii]OOM36061.1 HTH-type transcriptional regulator [Clostridium beijerinckii]
MNEFNELLELANEFKDCQKALIAIGNETRQLIITKLLLSDCMGSRVGDIMKKTNLSKPAVSHHLQILKNSNIISVRKEGTKNYYYLDAKDNELSKLIKLFNHVNTIMQTAPDRKGEE